MFYTMILLPDSDVELHTVNYYDTYVDVPIGFSAPVSVYEQDVTTRTNGLATVSKTRVLESNSWITTITYYDQKGRPIYVYSDNPYLGTVDIMESKLDDFTGKVLETKTTHKKTGKIDIVTVDRFEYDHMDRLVSQTQQINNQISERIVKNNYDDLGQLESKMLGNGTKAGYTDVTSGLTISNNEITKISGGGWAVGLATKGSIDGNGYVEFIANSDNTPMMIGLSNSNSNAHYSTINHAIYLYWTKRLIIYENGKHKGEYGKFVKGDVFRVERIGNTIHYKKNGETFYVSKTASFGSLLGDISMHTNGAKIKNFKIVDNNRGLQKVDYDYNVHGWLTAINEDGNSDNDLFNFSLKYNTGSEAAKYLYNGNIAQTTWQTQNIDPGTKSYVYNYDALNRIIGAHGTASDKYDLDEIGYDKNGNISNLVRLGHTNQEATVFDVMDDLTYTYDSGNKLLAVNDHEGIPFGFKDGNTNGNDYSYDTNGNMTKDWNKGISDIYYNHLNLPTGIDFGAIDDSTINYVYDATGVKLKKYVVNETTGAETETLYAGNYVYENGELQFFNHAEGYVQKDNLGKYNYVYQYKDHLGNIRLSFTDSNDDGEITTPTTEIFYDDASNTAGWDSVGALYGSSAIIDGKHTVSGSKAIKLSKNGSGEVYAHSNNWITINNTVVTDYIFSGWIYIEAPSSAYGRILLFMNENEETGYSTQIAEAPRLRQTNRWLYVEKRVTVPANIDKLNLRLGIYTGGSKVEGWFDDLRITKVNDASYSEILEEKNYYPFGLPQKGYNTMISSHGNSAAQKFGFTGKEHQDELGLGWIDITARNYDAALGRWMNIDPLAEEMRRHSPYNYAFNNPIYFMDPDGMKPQDWIKNLETGEVKWYDQKGDYAISAAAQKDGNLDQGSILGLSDDVKSKYKNLGEFFFGTKGETFSDQIQILEQQNEYLREVSNAINEKAGVEYTGKDFISKDLTHMALKSIFMENVSSQKNVNNLQTKVDDFIMKKVKSKAEGYVTGKLEKWSKLGKKTMPIFEQLLKSQPAGDGTRNSEFRRKAVNAFNSKVKPLLTYKTLDAISKHQYN
ncbi:hypothetical protein GBO31_23265 [Aquimarina litoralis]|nr:hypothetical protein [Aquimarina litoralis]